MSGVSFSLFYCCSHCLNVFAVSYTQNLPAVSLETHFNIFGEGNVGAAFNGNLVIIIKINQFTKA
ncbi:secreted protein [gut metagenome]|uniref:Secreted protein n=1 Tax=gut metagenome TaxID=749906 RepID=J9C8A4_9ZZZZ